MQRDDYDPYSDHDISYTPMSIPHSSTNFQEKVYVDDTPPDRRSVTAAEASHHPLSLVLIIIWIILIVSNLLLFELSVLSARTTVKLPWYYSNNGLPSVLFTIFAQGHVPVTAMHLRRLAVSTLHHHGSAPRTWLEMFWLADRKWAGPVGILMAIGTVLQSRMRISPTIVVFSVTILSALATPLVLNRAYPIHPLDVPVKKSFFPNTLAARKMGTVDAYAQMAVGAGSWATNLTVLELFNATTFVPASNSLRVADAADFFFAGDVHGMDVSLPGVRIQGGCHALDDQTNFTQASFTQFCSTQLSAGINDARTMTLGPFQLNMSYCTTGQWAAPVVPSNTTTLVWFANNDDIASVQGNVVRGVVRCDTTYTTGTAFLSGQNLTYDHFVENNGLYNATQGGEPVLDPSYAALYHFIGLQDSSDDQESQLLGMLGYTETAKPDGSAVYLSSTLDGLADAMWRGATHMTMALAVLSRESTTAYNGTAYVAVSARRRDTPFFTGALVLLGVWFLALVGMTTIIWRPTVLGDSLDSYSAARLAVDRPDLVGGVKLGGIEDNERLLERFNPVYADI